MLIINILGIAMMAFIIWWFWLWKPKTEPSVQPTSKSDVKEQSSPEQP